VSPFSSDLKVKKIQARLELSLGSRKNARAVFDAVFPELNTWSKSGTSVRLSLVERCVCAYIEAQTLSEARAAFNTIHSWFQVASRVVGYEYE
jgi:tRNA threonylcarbamoyladenosine modification (KEOPS) complex  Pcc1 subunit